MRLRSTENNGASGSEPGADRNEVYSRRMEALIEDWASEMGTAHVLMVLQVWQHELVSAIANPEPDDGDFEG